MQIKKSSIFFTAIICMLIVSCIPPKEHMADCNSTDGTYICFNNEGRDATYARWNLDTVETFNVFDIQGSYPAVPGTTGPWTTVNITLVNSLGNMGMETGLYSYYEFLTNSGERRFTFWLKRYEGDAKDPLVKNFVKDPHGTAFLSITNVDMTGKLTGLFEADVWNMADTTETAEVKYLFNGIPLQ